MDDLTLSQDSARVHDVIAASWCTVLDIPAVADDDDFFELGGHSIAVTRIVSYLRRELEVEVDIIQFWDTPAFGDFRAAIESLAARSA